MVSIRRPKPAAVTLLLWGAFTVAFVKLVVDGLSVEPLLLWFVAVVLAAIGVWAIRLARRQQLRTDAG
jgi:hypothetical protein